MLPVKGGTSHVGPAVRVLRTRDYFPTRSAKGSTTTLLGMREHNKNVQVILGDAPNKRERTVEPVAPVPEGGRGYTMSQRNDAKVWDLTRALGSSTVSFPGPLGGTCVVLG